MKIEVRRARATWLGPALLLSACVSFDKADFARPRTEPMLPPLARNTVSTYASSIVAVDSMMRDGAPVGFLTVEEVVSSRPSPGSSIWLIMSGFSVLTLNIFGMPFAYFEGACELRMAIHDRAGNTLAEVESTGSATMPMAFYYGYTETDAKLAAVSQAARDASDRMLERLAAEAPKLQLRTPLTARDLRNCAGKFDGWQRLQFSKEQNGALWRLLMADSRQENAVLWLDHLCTKSPRWLERFGERNEVGSFLKSWARDELARLGADFEQRKEEPGVRVKLAHPGAGSPIEIDVRLSPKNARLLRERWAAATERAARVGRLYR